MFLKSLSLFAASDCKGTQTFFNWSCDQGSNGVEAILIVVVNWLAIGVTIAVIGGIIYGAIQYTTSGGSPEQSKKAMGIIRNAIIALILYFAMWAALNWLVPGGMFN